MEKFYKIIKNIKVDKLLNIKNYLLLGNFVLVVALIVLENLNILPFRNIGDFGFFVALIFIVALYRPGWTFLFFAGTIMLENINLAPAEFGLILRPYQLIGLLTFLAVMVRYFTGRLGFGLPKISGVDILVLVFVMAGFFSSIFSLNKGIAFKQSLIIFSFAIIYYLTRIFVQRLSDIKKILPFFLESSLLVSAYGIWQNWIFMKGGNHFEIMPGRPNATFFEPDWLGMFIVLVISVVYAMIFYLMHLSKSRSEILTLDFWKVFYKRIFVYDDEFKKVFFHKILAVLFVVLILTVSRSAWVGVVAITILYIGLVFYFFGLMNKEWRKVREIFIYWLATMTISFLVIYVFGLTNFELGKRLQSTGGKQEITISCSQKRVLPKEIKNISELTEYKCRHINLEEIESEKKRGNFVAKIYRNDPNVNIRAEIYKKSWKQIIQHPILGIGWGGISQVLGKDENGNGLNSSNIFLEVWLGGGVIAFLSLTMIFILIFSESMVGLFRINEINFRKLFHWRGSGNFDEIMVNDKKPGKLDTGIAKSWNLFMLLSGVAVLIPNLFNAGIMLGFLWVWLGVVSLKNNN